jgi:hypothetical protein
MGVRLVCDRKGSMLNVPCSRIVEPQSLQLGWNIDLSQERRVVAHFGVVCGHVDP